MYNTTISLANGRGKQARSEMNVDAIRCCRYENAPPEHLSHITNNAYNVHGTD